MSSHASYAGLCVRINLRMEEGQRLPVDSQLVSYSALMVRPGGHYANAPTCTLYHHPEWGYIATDMRPPAKT